MGRVILRDLLALLLLTGCSEPSAPKPEGPLTGDALVEALQDGALVLYDATPEEGGAVVLRPDGDGRFLLVVEIAPGEPGSG